MSRRTFRTYSSRESYWNTSVSPVRQWLVRFWSYNRLMAVTLTLSWGIRSSVVSDLGLDLQKCGIGTDNASVMVGRENGVHAKLKFEVPHLVCICHSLQLAISEVCKEILPTKFEILVAETTAIQADLWSHYGEFCFDDCQETSKFFDKSTSSQLSVHCESWRSSWSRHQ